MRQTLKGKGQAKGRKGLFGSGEGRRHKKNSSHPGAHGERWGKAVGIGIAGLNCICIFTEVPLLKQLKICHGSFFIQVETVCYPPLAASPRLSISACGDMLSHVSHSNFQMSFPTQLRLLSLHMLTLLPGICSCLLVPSLFHKTQFLLESSTSPQVKTLSAPSVCFYCSVLFYFVCSDILPVSNIHLFTGSP